MDTAKVEIQKLQLLCDRINSMLDALNQVRQSVHGLSTNRASTTNGSFAAPPANSWQGATPSQNTWQTNAPWYAWHANAPWQTSHVWPISNPWQANVPQTPWNNGLAHTNPCSYQQTTPYWNAGLNHTNPYSYRQAAPYWNAGLNHTNPYSYPHQTMSYWNHAFACSNPYAYQQATPNWNGGLTHTNPYPYWQDQSAWMIATPTLVPVASTSSFHTMRNPYFMAANPIAQTANETRDDAIQAARMATGFPFAFANGTPRNGQ